MSFQMNIKNAEAVELATELANLEKTSLTQAVLAALRARKRELTKEDRFERAMAIARDTAARLGPNPIDHGELLYDEYGLPK
jgi:antitoxin VapB